MPPAATLHLPNFRARAAGGCGARRRASWVGPRHLRGASRRTFAARGGIGGHAAYIEHPVVHRTELMLVKTTRPLWITAVFVLAACSASNDASDGTSASISTVGTNGLASVKTVFIVVMENHNWSSIHGSASAPYINDTLLPMGAHAENYVNIPGLHPSEPNYLWLEAGSNFGVANDNLPSSNHQATTDHLVTKLEAAGITWKAYAEGASGTSCPVSNSGLYAPKHVPFVFFDDVRTNATRCTQHVRPYTELAGDLASGQVAQYNFITPNLCNDMHNSTGCATTNSLKNGDTWLSQELPKIFASSAYKTGGAVFVTFDESEGGDLPIAMIVLSPFAKPGFSNTIKYTHSSTLRTVQEIFGITPFIRDAANATDLSDLFLSGGGTDAGTDSGEGGGSCAHDVCVTGGKLVKTCDACAQAVCAKDAFCCSTSWDSTCVKEVAQSGCGRTCSADAGTDSGSDASADAGGDSGSACAHDVCATGGKLVKTCDACAQAVCASDAFCCSSSWDSICVSEVAQSSCGRTCP